MAAAANTGGSSLDRRPSVIWIEGDQDLMRFNPGTLGLFDVEADLDGDNSVSQQAINEQVKRNLLQVSSSLDDLQVANSSSASSYLFGSLYQSWRHVGRYSKRMYVNRMVRKYCFRFKTAIQKGSFPGQAMYLFETTLKMDNLLDLFKESSPEEEEDKIEFTAKESTLLYFFGISGIKSLVNALDITYSMINKLGIASHFVAELLNKEGFVSKGSSEHQMCIETYWELLNLIRRLEILSHLWKRKLIHSYVGNQLILSAFDVPLKKIEALASGFTQNLYASSVTEIKMFLLVFCETLHKVAASLCFVISQCFQYEEKDLNTILKDYVSIMTHSDVRIESYIKDFDTKEVLEKNQDDMLVGLSKQTYFSREHKLMRQYYWIGNLCYRFQAHTSSLASIVQTFNQEKENDPEVAQSLAGKIFEQHDHAVSLLQQITLLMDAQGKFIRLLKTQPQQVEEANADGFVTANESDNQPSLNESLEDPEPIIYKSDSDDVPDDEEEPAGKDELFVRFPEAEGNDEPVPKRDEYEEENVATTLYTGVLAQLNETIASLKAKTDKHENELLKEYMLKSNIAADDLTNVPSGSGININAELQQQNLQASSSRSPLVNKLLRKSTKRHINEIDSDDDNYGGSGDFAEPLKPGVSTCGENFSKSFMAELQSKLSPEMMSQITELSYGGDGSSSDSDVSTSDTVKEN